MKQAIWGLLACVALVGACSEAAPARHDDAGFGRDAATPTACEVDTDCRGGEWCVEGACAPFRVPEEDAGSLPEVDGGVSPPEDGGAPLGDAGSPPRCVAAVDRWTFETPEVHGLCASGSSPLQYLEVLRCSGELDRPLFVAELQCDARRAQVSEGTIAGVCSPSSRSWTLTVTPDRIEDGLGCYVLRSDAVSER